MGKDSKRLARYKQKINFVAEKIGSLPKKIDNQLTIDATLYRIQTAIDGAMDVVAMMVKDKGKEVGDDYENIHKLQSLKILSKKLAEDLAMLNGLRNAIVHKYNSFEEKTVINNIVKIEKILISFLEVVESEIKTIFK